MPLDSSIPLQGREFRLMSPVEAQSQALQLRSLQAQEQQRQAQAMAAQRAQQDQARLSDLYRSNYNNPDEFDRSAAQSGLGHLLPGIQKGRAEIDEKRAKTKETEAQTKNWESMVKERGVDTMLKQTKHVVDAMGWISNKPGLTDDDVVRALASSPPEMRGAAEQVMRTAPWGQGEGALKQWAMGLGRNAQQRWEDLNVTAAQKLQNDTAQRGQNMTAQTAREGHGVTMRGQNLTNERARELNANAATANEINREAQQSQIINDPITGPMIVNKGTKTAVPALMDGKPVPGEVITKAKRSSEQMGSAVAEAEKLLPKATGSGIGALTDKAAGFFGGTPGGATEAARLKTLSGWLVSNVPRMEGPQSNIDVQNYKEMAGQVGDPSIPVKQRLAALDTLKTLQAKYSGINGDTSPKPKRPPLDSFNR